LLEARFERVNGRVGPGAGRTSKLYVQSSRTVDVSLPPRRYELAARLLLRAIATSPTTRRQLTEVAHEVGTEIGEQGFDEALRDLGYRPVDEGDVTRFRNCPFDALRQLDQETTCDLNLALVEGMLVGSGSDSRAELAPEAGFCCVRLHANKEESA
jgi:predicted ArsR family transcriptional regulator